MSDLPLIKTVREWRDVIAAGHEIVSLPVESGSGSVASRIATDDTAEGYSEPKSYTDQDRVAHLIESLFGAWPADDPAVINAAVRSVAKQTSRSSNAVWNMSFSEFVAALSDPELLLHARLNGPPTPMQQSIWKALDGRALDTKSLANEVAGGDRPRLYYINKKTKAGGLRELQAAGLTELRLTVGHYRPDSPPATN